MVPAGRASCNSSPSYSTGDQRGAEGWWNAECGLAKLPFSTFCVTQCAVLQRPAPACCVPHGVLVFRAFTPALAFVTVYLC